MKKTHNKITFKLVLNETKKSHNGLSMQLLYFSLFTIASFALAYVTPFSLIITIPCIIIPSYFAFSAMNSIKGAKNAEGASFFKMFKTYFSQFFFGGYRLIIGFLKSFLAYLVTNMFLHTILDYTVLRKNAEYVKIVDKIQTTTDLDALVNELNSFLLNNAEIQKYILLVVSISVLVATYIFIQHIFKHSIKMRRNLFSRQPFPVRQYHFVDKRVRKDNRAFLYSTYIRTGWFIKLLLILMGGAGITLSYFFLKEFDAGHAIVISYFLMFVSVLPLMNYISKTQDLIYIDLIEVYEETFARLTLEFIGKYKDKLGLPDEDAKKIEELLKGDIKSAEEVKKEKQEDDKK